MDSSSRSSGKPPEAHAISSSFAEATGRRSNNCLKRSSRIEPARPAKKSRPGRFKRPAERFIDFGRDGLWWAEKGELILTGASKADEILEVLDGRQPSAVDHPLRTLLAKAEESFELVAAGSSTRAFSSRFLPARSASVSTV